MQSNKISAKLIVDIRMLVTIISEYNFEKYTFFR